MNDEKPTTLFDFGINVSKIIKEHMNRKGPGEVWVNFRVVGKPSMTPDDRGSFGFIVQALPKGALPEGQRSPILGNIKHAKDRQQPKPSAPKPAPAQPEAEDDVPF